MTTLEAPARAAMGFGSKADGGFNELTKAYKQTPTIENYVRLRREDPAAEIEISILGGMEPLFYMEDELRRFKIDPLLVASIMDADSDAIGEISHYLMEKIIEGRSLQKEGKSHLV
ncbi:MAG: hypothetical protein WA280_21645, partial [Xanthobacteraceae bacterium]